MESDGGNRRSRHSRIKTKNGGESEPPFHSLNTGLHVQDHEQHVINNRKKVADILKTDLHDWVFADQTHEDRIHKVTDGDRASGAFRYDTALKATGQTYTDRPNLFLALCFADCVPVYFSIRSARWSASLTRAGKAPHLGSPPAWLTRGSGGRDESRRHPCRDRACDRFVLLHCRRSCNRQNQKSSSSARRQSLFDDKRRGVPSRIKRSEQAAACTRRNSKRPDRSEFPLYELRAFTVFLPSERPGKNRTDDVLHRIKGGIAYRWM